MSVAAVKLTRSNNNNNSSSNSKKKNSVENSVKKPTGFQSSLRRSFFFSISLSGNKKDIENRFIYGRILFFLFNGKCQTLSRLLLFHYLKWENVIHQKWMTWSCELVWQKKICWFDGSVDMVIIFLGEKKSCGEKRFRDSIDGIKLVIEPPLWSWYSFGIFLLNRIFYWRGAVWSSLMSRWPAGRCSSMHLIKSTAAPVTWKAANERAVTNKTPDLYRILPGFTGFYWVLLAFTRFY